MARESTPEEAAARATAAADMSGVPHGLNRTRLIGSAGFEVPGTCASEPVRPDERKSHAADCSIAARIGHRAGDDSFLSAPSALGVWFDARSAFEGVFERKIRDTNKIQWE